MQALNFNITEKATRIVSQFLDKRLPPESDFDRLLVDDLRSRFRSLPEMSGQGEISVESSWMANLSRLRDLVLNDDPRGFLQWDVIRETMFVASAPYLRSELKFLKNQPNWSSRWKAAIRESPTGNPPVYPFKWASSGNLIHHAYHVARYEEWSGVAINELNFVFEFGGGYGSMCRLFRNLGFKGRYVIFDLPHFSALQEFYLKSQEIKVYDSPVTGPLDEFGCELISDIADLNDFLNNFNHRRSIFIGTWSISEVPISLRDTIRPLLANFGSLLIAYQNQFESVDNIKYFDRWKEDLDKTLISEICAIEHLPLSKYFFARKDR